MGPHADDDHAVEGGIGLAVASSVEAVSVGLAAGGRDGTGAAELGQGRFGVDALGVVADENEHLGGGARAHAGRLHQFRCEALGQLPEAGIMVPDFGVEGQPAASDRPQAGFGGGHRRGERAWAQGGEMSEQRHLAAQAFEVLAQCRGRADDDSLERLHGLAPRLDRRVAGHLEMTDHLDRARPGLRRCGCLAGQDAPGGALGVDHIVLALMVPELAARSVDLENRMTLLAQEPGQACAVGSSALDTKGTDRAEGPCPVEQSLIAAAVRGNGQAAEEGTERTDRDDGVGGPVGVDADDDAGIG